MFLLFSVVMIVATAIVIFVPFNSTAREKIDDLARKGNAETDLRGTAEVSPLPSVETVQESLCQTCVAYLDLISDSVRWEHVFFLH